MIKILHLLHYLYYRKYKGKIQLRYEYQQIMRTILYLSAVLLTITQQAPAQIFKRTRKALHMPANIRQMEYSLDQKILAVSNDTSTTLYDGVTIEQIKKYDHPAGVTFATFSFSQDESMFAIGYKNQQGTIAFGLFNRINDQENEVQGHAMYEGVQHNLGLVGDVSSICFTADNAHLILGTHQGEIYLFKSKDDFHSIKFNDSIPVSSVACSSQRSLQFAVAGHHQQQTRLATYTFDPLDLQITEQHNFDLAEPTETINSIRYSVGASSIYYCGSSHTITAVGVDEPHTVRSFITGLSNFLKVRTTTKDDVVVACTADSLYIEKPSATGNKLQGQQVESIFAPTFALGQQGANIVYALENNIVQVTGQCPDGAFLDTRTDKCVLCNTECSLCLDRASLCFQCKQAHYVSSAYSCLQCLPNCKSCSTANTCNTCYDPFILVDHQLCGCEKGKYVNGKLCSACPEGCLDCVNDKVCTECDTDYQRNDDGLCQYQSGLPTWVIVLLIVLGVAIVLIITGIVFIKMRKGEKRSPLLTDSDEGQKQRVSP